MKDNQQLGQAIFKSICLPLTGIVSEGKRKQLFNHLLNEFRNSKVNIGTPNYMSGGGMSSNGGAGMHGPSTNLSGSTPSTIKASKKKSSSIDKKNTSSILNSNTDILKKTIPKKGVNHKKSKSYITQNLTNINDTSQHSQNYYQQVVRKDAQGNSTLENSFGHGLSNKSYERLFGETLEPQASNAGYNSQAAGTKQLYNVGNAGQVINQKVISQSQVSGSQSGHKNQQSFNNMTLQLNSKRGTTQYDNAILELANSNVSQSRYGQAENSESQIKRENSQSNGQSSKSNHNSHKSLSSNSKYDQQQRKKSRGSDQFYMNQRSKCESNRTSKKNSPNNTINTTKNTISIREARTKPTSPERSYVLINSYKGQKQQPQTQKNVYIAGSHIVNQREERKAMNMISSLGGQQAQPSLSQNPRVINQAQIQVIPSQQRSTNEFVSIQQQASNKRKNFKNMFYSPKGGRDAFTEPHSKVPSQAQTKEHSPAHKMLEISQQYNTQHNQQILPQAAPLTALNAGHHPKLRASAKPPTQMKSKGIMYSTKDSNNRSKVNSMNQQQLQELEGVFNTNSFLEESYVKNATNNYQLRRDDISFDSSNNQFSQTGTPNQYKVSGGKPSGGGIAVKKINVIGRENLGGSGGSNQGSLITPAIHSSSTIERGPKKIVISNHLPNTTGVVTKNNSQAPSPSNLNFSSMGNQQPKKQRFQSEAPSPVNKQINQDSLPQKKRGISIGAGPGTNIQSYQQDSIESLNQSKKISGNNLNAVVTQKVPNQNQQQFLFNQYVKAKKQRHQLESNDASLERGTSSMVNPSIVTSNDQFFDQPSQKTQSQSQVSPRMKEVVLIKSLIKECFQKYGKPPKTQIELYKIGKMLGKGAFGRVNLGLHRLSRRLVAIKAINMEFMKDESSKKKMSNEISILKMLRHPNVVKLLETFDTDKHHLIVMELCPGGDLLNYVRKRRKLNEKMAKFVFKQIMEGIQYVHHNGVVHRDIKLDNILLDGHGNIKIADFGVSRKYVDNETLFEQCGTPAYIAPEIVRELGYKGFSVDIWSAGVCLYAMLYGNVPFKANQMGDLNKMILDATIEYKDTASEEARDLMQRMLQKNPNKRLNAEEVLDHPWFDDVDEGINIFDEQELELIKKEFTYVSQKGKLKELRERKPEDLNTEFTEHSINSNDNTLMKNNSSRSVILCPFNTQAGTQAKSIYEDIQELLADRDMAIRFNARVRELNRQYEKFNNQDFDNGVYHKYAYNQGKNKDEEERKRQEEEALKEEVISSDEVHNKNLVRKRRGMKSDLQFQNYYLKVDEKIVGKVEDFGFPRPYVHKCINENVNNHCTTSYYLLCMDQNY